MNSTELAKAVATELLSGGSIWLFLFTSALFAGVGAYFGKYFGTKGANLATKEDFNFLQGQLSASTRLVASIKSEIDRADWLTREWNALRIKKIEELMTILHECEEYLGALKDASIACEYHPNIPPFDHAIVISELYLPELADAVRSFITKCQQLKIAMINLAQQGVAIKQQDIQKDTAFLWENFVDNSGYNELFPMVSEIRTSTRLLLQKIVSSRKPD